MVRNRTSTAVTPHPMASEVSSRYSVEPYESSYWLAGCGSYSVSIMIPLVSCFDIPSAAHCDYLKAVTPLVVVLCSVSVC